MWYLDHNASIKEYKFANYCLWLNSQSNRALLIFLPLACSYWFTKNLFFSNENQDSHLALFIQGIFVCKWESCGKKQSAKVGKLSYPLRNAAYMD